MHYIVSRLILISEDKLITANLKTEEEYGVEPRETRDFYFRKSNYVSVFIVFDLYLRQVWIWYSTHSIYKIATWNPIFDYQHAHCCELRKMVLFCSLKTCYLQLSLLLLYQPPSCAYQLTSCIQHSLKICPFPYNDYPSVNMVLISFLRKWCKSNYCIILCKLG